MSTVVATQRAEVDALTTELSGLESLNDRHQTAASEAARKHRAGKLSADELQAATSAAAAVAYALEQTRTDLANARAALAEAESAAEDEVHLAAIAAATVEYTEAEREHREMLDATEHALARAITRSAELMRAASDAKTRASKAAHILAEKHRTDDVLRTHDEKRLAGEDTISVVEARFAASNGRMDVSDAMLARAVRGSEVAPLRTGANVTKWPFGNRQTYKLVSQVKPKTMGVAVGEVEAGA